MKLYKPTYKDKNGKKKKCNHYYLTFTDNRGSRRRLPAYSNKRASEKLSEKIEELLSSGGILSPDLQRWIENLSEKTRDQLVKFGLIDKARTIAAKPLTEHIEDYRKSLEANNRTAGYIKTSIASIKKTIAECTFVNCSDIQAEKVESYLANWRNKSIGIRTSNFHLKALKGFCNWMVRSGRANTSPIRFLRTLDPKLDPRHPRRPLEVDEVRRLLETARNAKAIYGVSGCERALVYRLAIESGLRRNELRSLTKNSFDFENHTVTVQPKDTKNRKPAILPLRPDTAMELKRHLANRLPTAKVFPVWMDKAAAMIKADLKAAKIPYEDEAGRFCDFHALRHTCGSLLAASGVHPKIAQSIMRHSDINLTMSLYTHTLRGQEAEAIQNLPDFTIKPSKKIG